MSADNRILIYQDPKTETWFVWEASCSINYFEPPKTAQTFGAEELALAYAFGLEDKYYFEGGTQKLTEQEIFQGLEDEIDSLKREIAELKDETKLLKQENTELKELVDGVYEIVEIWNTKGSKYNTEVWKPDWLKKAKKYGAGPDF